MNSRDITELSYLKRCNQKVIMKDQNSNLTEKIMDPYNICSMVESAEEAVSHQCLLLSGIVDQNHHVWIAYRPTG